MSDEEKALYDQFAKHAVQGCLAAFKHWPTDSDISRVAEVSYKVADAMLEERAKRVKK